VLSQLLRRPVRGLAALADRAQHQQAHHHALLAAMEQRRERAQQVAGAKQRMQVGKIGRDGAVAQVVLQG
jgi:hypothetical protein